MAARLHLPRKASAIDMTPEQFLAKLVALVPPPNHHLVRDGGVFAMLIISALRRTPTATH